MFNYLKILTVCLIANCCFLSNAWAMFGDSLIGGISTGGAGDPPKPPSGQGLEKGHYANVISNLKQLLRKKIEDFDSAEGEIREYEITLDESNGYANIMMAQRFHVRTMVPLQEVERQGREAIEEEWRNFTYVFTFGLQGVRHTMPWRTRPRQVNETMRRNWIGAVMNSFPQGTGSRRGSTVSSSRGNSPSVPPLGPPLVISSRMSTPVSSRSPSPAQEEALPNVPQLTLNDMVRNYLNGIVAGTLVNFNDLLPDVGTLEQLQGLVNQFDRAPEDQEARGLLQSIASIIRDLIERPNVNRQQK